MGRSSLRHLSALFETLLLLVTCIWIIHEATDRLLYKSVEVKASVWAFAVMITSIVVDVHRSRMLYRAAHKHKSQALEADALHFSTDIWSSAVVLLGLVCLKLAAWFPALQVLDKADSIAALGVAVIVIIISGRMGLSSIQQLLDTAPVGMVEKITVAVETMPGVVDCHHVRLRHSGPLLFVDIHVLMDGNQTLRAAHSLTDDIERHIQNIVPDSDVTVHPEPIELATQPSNSTTKS
jgi:cation diffusion facilitator family transporter